jgi:xylulokinase
MPIILGLDVSTQSVTGIIINTENGEIECNLSINYGISFIDKYNSPQGFIIDENNENIDEVYSNPLMWIDGIELLFNDLSKIYDLSKIEAISGAGQQHASIYLNENWFNVIKSFNLNEKLSDQIKYCLSFNKSPIWLDKSTTIECNEINDIIGKNSIIKKTGSQMTERFTGSQIRKIYKNNNDIYINTKRIHFYVVVLYVVY